MGCPHRSHFVKTASIGPTPLSVSGAVLEYSLRLLSQFLICAPSLPYRRDRPPPPPQPPPGLLRPFPLCAPRLPSRRDRLAHPAQPRPGLPGPALADEPHQLAPDDYPVRLGRRLGRRLRRRHTRAQPAAPPPPRPRPRRRAASACSR